MLLEMRMKLATMGFTFDMQKLEMEARLREMEGIYAHDASFGEVSPWLNDFRASVRPVITYLFFIFFVGIKIAILVYVLPLGADFLTALNLVWDDTAQGVFSSIVAFWFGSRMIEKYRNRQANEMLTKSSTNDSIGVKASPTKTNAKTNFKGRFTGE